MTTKVDRRAMLIAGGGAIGAAALAIAKGGSAQAPASGGNPLPNFGERIPVAFVMGEGSTMIDFAGPWEVFQDTGGAGVPGFYLYTVSDSREPRNTTGNFLDGKPGGMRFIPDFTYADAPQPKVIMMGAQGQHTPAKIAWIRHASVAADFVYSNCTGAFLLAKTGLLDDLSATTHHDFFDSFEKQFPKVKLVRDARYVDNGKVITSGGLTSGIDGALHIVDRIYGREVAQKVVKYMEYSGDGWSTRTRY